MLKCKSCPECQRPVPRDAPDGLCPICLCRILCDAEPMAATSTVDFLESTVDHAVTTNRAPLRIGPRSEMGRYEFRREHAVGGQGKLAMATDTELGRDVVLKQLKPEYADIDAFRRRFLLEAEVTARLDHPGIVPVHGLFEDEMGRPCYAMRYIDGEPFSKRIQAYHAGPRDTVAFRRLLHSFIQVCETMAYAHSRGVKHRDLKPENVMLGKFGETMVVDWGLAKIAGRPETLTQTDAESIIELTGDSNFFATGAGVAFGTPGYVSPEQATDSTDADARSDVYSLGAMLYVILTGRPTLKYRGNWPELQKKLRRGDFPSPRTIKPSVPKPLEAICLKALAVDPEDRYQTSTEVAAEVECWLADEPVQGYREPINERLSRWARHHKGFVRNALISVFILILSGWVVSIAARKAATRKRLLAYQEGNVKMNDRKTGHLTIRFNKLDQAASKAFDELVAGFGRDNQWKTGEAKRIRAESLHKAITYWESALKIDSQSLGPRSGRSVRYKSRRAMCVALLGKHEEAFSTVQELQTWATTKDRSGTTAYDLARVCALCASSASDESSSSLANRYAEACVAFLNHAARFGLFKEMAPTNRLLNDPDFDEFIRSRDDFEELLRMASAQ